MTDRREPKRTKITWDLGTLAHFVYGLMSAFLRPLYLTMPVFTAIFLLKQSIDWLSGEDYAEQSGDIAEYATGMVAGLLLIKLGVW